MVRLGLRRTDRARPVKWRAHVVPPSPLLVPSNDCTVEQHLALALASLTRTPECVLEDHESEAADDMLLAATDVLNGLLDGATTQDEARTICARVCDSGALRRMVDGLESPNTFILQARWLAAPRHHTPAARATLSDL